MTNTIDIKASADGAAGILSNLYPHSFQLDGIICGGMEGFIQSLKYPDPTAQMAVASLSGHKARNFGRLGLNWMIKQELYWKGKPYARGSRQYKNLIRRAYQACFDQNPLFRETLFHTGLDTLVHYMGNSDQTKTPLTEAEFMFELYRLRSIVQQEGIA